MSDDDITITDRLAIMLYLIHSELHPIYGNTSRRGRGIGGQAITQQCSVIDPEGDENAILDAIEHEYRAWFHRAVEGNRNPQALVAEFRASLRPAATPRPEEQR